MAGSGLRAASSAVGAAARKALTSWDFWRRLLQLNVGLLVVGLGIALMLDAGIGLGPWTVFHQGLSFVTGLSIGRVMQGVGLVVVL